MGGTPAPENYAHSYDGVIQRQAKDLLFLFIDSSHTFRMTRSALWSHYPKCRGGNLPPVIEAFTVIG